MLAAAAAAAARAPRQLAPRQQQQQEVVVHRSGQKPSGRAVGQAALCGYVWVRIHVVRYAVGRGDGKRFSPN